MIYFFRRGAESLSCETRLNPAAAGYELIVTDQDRTPRIEGFATLADMLAREHELLQAWRAQGWQEIGTSKQRQR